MAVLVMALAAPLLPSGVTARPANNSPADNAASGANYMPVGGQVPAPTGFLELCVRSPEDCQHSQASAPEHIIALARTALIEKRQSMIRTAKVEGRANAPMALEQAPVVAALSDARHEARYMRIDLNMPAMAMVAGINDRVNHIIHAETDQQVYHTGDYWTAPGLEPGTRGDCEDFALEKRRLLMAAGVPAAALSIAILRTPAGEAHAVLIVSARQGDFVLDNLQPEVKSWQMTGYSWISRQGPGGDLNWVSLAPANAPGPDYMASR